MLLCADLCAANSYSTVQEDQARTHVHFQGWSVATLPPTTADMGKKCKERHRVAFVEPTVEGTSPCDVVKGVTLGSGWVQTASCAFGHLSGTSTSPPWPLTYSSLLCFSCGKEASGTCCSFWNKEAGRSMANTSFSPRIFALALLATSFKREGMSEKEEDHVKD